MSRPKKWINPVKTYVGSKKVVPAYSHWRHVLERCSQPYQLKYPTYMGTIHQESWSDYDEFYEWIVNQSGYGVLDKGRLYHLDKDLLGNGFLYSEETCCLLPSQINVAMQHRRSTSGELPVGVSLNQGRYMVTLAYDGRNRNLGRYSCPEEAGEIYRKEKVDRLRKLAIEYQPSISKKAFDALNSITFKD